MFCKTGQNKIIISFYPNRNGIGHFPGDYDKYGQLVRARGDSRTTYSYSPDQDLLLEVTLGDQGGPVDHNRLTIR